jgi:hypothetical protein
MGGQEIEQLIRLLGSPAGVWPALGPAGGPVPAPRAAIPGWRRWPAPWSARARPSAPALPAGIWIRSDPCHICADPLRDQGALVCVVETVGDLWALERAGVHRGVYQVLGGTLSPLAGHRAGRPQHSRRFSTRLQAGHRARGYSRSGRHGGRGHHPALADGSVWHHIPRRRAR